MPALNYRLIDSPHTVNVALRQTEASITESTTVKTHSQCSSEKCVGLKRVVGGTLALMDSTKRKSLCLQFDHLLVLLT